LVLVIKITNRRVFVLLVLFWSIWHLRQLFNSNLIAVDKLVH
jgi:hypothetical protein